MDKVKEDEKWDTSKYVSDGSKTLFTAPGYHFKELIEKKVSRS